MANINIPDSALFQAGAGPDLKITHNGSNSIISNATGTLTINNIADANMVLSTNNTDAVTIDNAQNVGIGDTDPSEAKLSITGVLVGDVGLLVDQDQDQYGIQIDHDGASSALYAHGEASVQHLMHLEAPNLTTGSLIKMASTSDDLVSAADGGMVEMHYTGNAGADVNNLLHIKNDHASSTGTTCLKIQQDSTGPSFVTTGGNVGLGEIAPNGNVSLHISDALKTIRIEAPAGNVTDGTLIGALEFYGGDPTSAGPGVKAAIRGLANGTNGGGIIALYTATTAGAGGNDNLVCKWDMDGTMHQQAGTANFGGNVAITGSISKGSGSFKIEHPLPSKKDTHYLVHSFTESPRADLIYRDKVTLVDGSATVNIDSVSGMTEGTFVLLCDNVQCFTSNESDWKAVKGSVSGNILTIECEDSSSTANISWMVVGDRKDEHIMDTDWTDEDGKPIIEPEIEVLENA